MGSLKGFKGNQNEASSEGSHNSPHVRDAFTAAVATVVRAQPKDFKLVKQEWAATRIQTAFRAFLVTLSFPFLQCNIYLPSTYFIFFLST